MGFGAAIATGEQNLLLAEDLAGCLLEVRVEQKLDEPTLFAVRFIEDIVDGKPVKASQPPLQPGQIMTIAANGAEGLQCLVRGPIVEQESEMTLGGPGSAFTVKGIDRRDLLDRTCNEKSWTGTASTAAMAVLLPVYPLQDVGVTEKVYGPQAEALNQRGTDLKFLTDLAKQNNFHFWISYFCQQVPGSLVVVETAHWNSSPKRPESGGGTGLPSLIPSSDLALRVHVPKERCPNVSAFQLKVDSRRPSQYRGAALNAADLGDDATNETDPQPATEGGSKRVESLDGARDLCMPGLGDPQETRSRAQAALTEAGWFVNATASTTRHLYGGILQPHDIVSIEGIGPKNGKTAFRVQEVVHVINAVEHIMDLVLKSNALAEDS
jgi:hypothetical protein